MNQTNSRDLTLSAAEARNIHADIFELLAQMAELAAIKQKAADDAVVNVEMDGGGFR